MSEIKRDEFLRQKIANFIIFIASKIGTENLIYKDFSSYLGNLDLFIADMNKIKSMNINEDTIKTYLEFKKITTKIKTEDFDKIKRYFAMFMKVLFG